VAPAGSTNPHAVARTFAPDRRRAPVAEPGCFWV
jgi:hypothetical protein